MKRILKVAIGMLSISVLALMALAQGKDVGGGWITTLQRGGQTSTLKMKLKVAGNSVTGTIDVAPDVTAQIQNGKLEGNQLTFDVIAPEHGHTKNIRFTGALGEDTITLRNESRGRQGRTLIFQRANN